MKRKVVMALAMCSLLVFLVPLISGFKTVKTIDGYLDYIPQTTADQIYWKLITIDPPDRIAEVFDAQILVTGDFQAQTKVRAKIENQFCSPSYWQTPNLDIASYDIIFDCSDIAQNFKGGDINLSFMTDKIAQNVIGTYKMTYYNDPEISLEEIYKSVKADISIGATQYIAGETGTIFAKVTEEGQAVSNAFCDVLLFNSNQTEIDGFQLLFVNGSRGLYSNTFSVPSESGVYMVDAECFRPFNESYQIHYFAGDGEPAYDLYFTNQTGTNKTYIELVNVPTGGYVCHPDRWSQSYSDFDDGTFNPYRFLHGMHNISIWVKKDLGTPKYFDVVIRFYKETEKGELTLGAVTNTTQIGTTAKEIFFADTVVNAPFGALDLLEVEVCFKSIDDSATRTISVWFNGSDADSQFGFHTLSADAPLDFQVGGSSEIHVVDWANISVNLNVNATETLVREIWNYSERVTTQGCQLIVSGTEYNSNETGILYAQFLRTVAGSPTPISDGICNITIHYPDETIFINNQNMLYISGSNGIYKYNFTVPETEGVYVADVYCRRGGIKAYSSETYHVGEWANRIVTGNITLTTLEDILNDILDNQSTLYNEILNTPANVWNYSNRTLTIDEYELIMGGTEYVSGDEGTAWVQILYKGEDYIPINDANCSIFGRYPNASIWVYNESMPYVSGSFGLYRYNFTVPDQEGTYWGVAYCIRGDDELIVSGTFHVSNYPKNIYNYLIAHNQSMWNKMVFLENLMLQINGSLWNKLFLIQDELADITDLVIEVGQNVTTTNSSIHTHIDEILTEIQNIDFNTTELENLIKNTNLTIMTKLHGVQGELAQILENQTIIKQMIYDHNTTVYDKLLEVQGNLVYISNQINNTNQTLYDMIYGTNLTIMTKLYLMQDELANITDLINVSINLIYNTNETIMTYLYLMNNSLWSEIYNIWNSIANVTNISMEITANMTTLPKEVYLYFQTVEERLIHNNDFCISNGTTHRKELLTEKCVAGECFNITKNIDEVCPYGCVQGTCLPTPTVKYSLFILAILLMLGFMFMMYQIARRV